MTPQAVDRIAEALRSAPRCTECRGRPRDLEDCPTCLFMAAEHVLRALAPKRSLTVRQREVLSFVQGYIGEHGYSPTFTEIAQRFGFKSLATVNEHIANLIDRGYLFQDRQAGARSLMPTELAS